jgi:hypothetical protein
MGSPTSFSLTPPFFTELKLLEDAATSIEAGTSCDYYHLKSLELRLDKIRNSIFSDATQEISNRIIRIQRTLKAANYA